LKKRQSCKHSLPARGRTDFGNAMLAAKVAESQ
jgi:hypothetical protein